MDQLGVDRLVGCSMVGYFVVEHAELEVGLVGQGPHHQSCQVQIAVGDTRRSLKERRLCGVPGSPL